MTIPIRKNTAQIITVGPFLDKTDGVSPELSLTVTGCHTTLVADTADGNAPTLVIDADATASGGDNDLVHIANDNAGYYSLELTAAQTNRNGHGRLCINDDDVHCPVFHDLVFLDANVFDSLYGTDKLNVDMVEISGDSAAADNLEAACDGGTYNVGGGAVVAASVTTKTDYALTSAYDAAKSAAPAGAKMDIVDAPNSTAVTAIQAGLAKPADIPSAGSVADAVLDEALGSHTGFLTGLLTAAGYTAPPSVGDIANAVWGAATRSLTEKTGFSLSVTPPTAQNIWEYATRALTDKSGFSGSGTVTDKTGFSLAVTPPTAGDIASAVWGAVTRSLTDKADFSLSTAGILAIWHQLLSSIATSGSIGKLIKDNLDAKVSEVGGGSLTAESIRIEMDANSKLANLPTDPADESSLEAAITAAHATTDALISAITGGGLTEKTYTLTDASTGLPLAGVQVWATTDEAGLNQVDITRTTNDAGQVTFRFNLAAGTPIYIWNRYMAEGDAPDEEEV